MSAIADGGLAQDSVEFAPGVRLTYRVQVVPDGVVGASYEGHCVNVVLPQPVVDQWRQPEEVSIEAEQPLADGQSLRILVEKDFECLAPREGEDQGGLFPNPSAEPA